MKKTTIEFSSKMISMIINLLDYEDARSIQEVVRNSVGLYHIAKNEQRKGNKIAILDKDNNMVKEISLKI